MRRLFSGCACALWLTLLCVSTVSYGQDAVSLEVVRKGQKKQSVPQLVVLPQVDIDLLTVRVACGGATGSHQGPAKMGARIALDLDTSIGVHSCSGTLSIRFDDGAEGQMPLSFEVQMLPQLGITAPKEQVDLEGHSLNVVLDRPAASVEVELFGLSGQAVGSASVEASGQAAGTPITVHWADPGEEVIRLVVTGKDQNGFWSQLELKPWFYEIPHEDVVFETGKSEIREQEAPKLQDTLVEINKVIQKYGAVVSVKLYVVGHTDTVGDSGGNLALSRHRAAAIARWFQGQGFTGEVYYQGVGEEGLAVGTADGVDEARNRRVVYILAADSPPFAGQNSASRWSQLQ